MSALRDAGRVMSACAVPIALVTELGARVQLQRL